MNTERFSAEILNEGHRAVLTIKGRTGTEWNMVERTVHTMTVPNVEHARALLPSLGFHADVWHVMEPMRYWSSLEVLPTANQEPA